MKRVVIVGLILIVLLSTILYALEGFTGLGYSPVGSVQQYSGLLIPDELQLNCNSDLIIDKNYVVVPPTRRCRDNLRTTYLGVPGNPILI